MEHPVTIIRQIQLCTGMSMTDSKAVWHFANEKLQGDYVLAALAKDFDSLAVMIRSKRPEVISHREARIRWNIENARSQRTVRTTGEAWQRLASMSPAVFQGDLH